MGAVVSPWSCVSRGARGGLVSVSLVQARVGEAPAREGWAMSPSSSSPINGKYHHGHFGSSTCVCHWQPDCARSPLLRSSRAMAAGARLERVVAQLGAGRRRGSAWRPIRIGLFRASLCFWRPARRCETALSWCGCSRSCRSFWSSCRWTTTTRRPLARLVSASSSAPWRLLHLLPLAMEMAAPTTMMGTTTSMMAALLVLGGIALPLDLLQILVTAAMTRWVRRRRLFIHTTAYSMECGCT